MAQLGQFSTFRGKMKTKQEKIVKLHFSFKTFFGRSALLKLQKNDFPFLLLPTKSTIEIGIYLSFPFMFPIIINNFDCSDFVYTLR